MKYSWALKLAVTKKKKKKKSKALGKADFELCQIHKYLKTALFFSLKALFLATYLKLNSHD